MKGETLSKDNDSNGVSKPMKFKCGKILKGHINVIYSLIQLQGNTAISYGEDKFAMIWDLSLGQCNTVIHDSNAYVLVLSNSNIALCFKSYIISIINPLSGKSLMNFQGHTAYIKTLLELKENRLASSSFDMTIRLWDLSTGDCLHVFIGHTYYISCFKHLSTGHFVSLSIDEIILWDTSSRQALKIIKNEFEESLLELSDGRIASCVQTSHIIKVYTPLLEECVMQLKGHRKLITRIKELSNHRLGSCACDVTVRIWDLMTGECLKILVGHTSSMRCIEELPDGQLASCSEDMTIRLWDLSSGACNQRLRAHTFSVDDVYLLSTGQICSISRDKTIILWDIDSDKT